MSATSSFSINGTVFSKSELTNCNGLNTISFTIKETRPRGEEDITITHEIIAWGKLADFFYDNFEINTVVAVKGIVTKVNVKESHPLVFFNATNITPLSQSGEPLNGSSDFQITGPIRRMTDLKYIDGTAVVTLTIPEDLVRRGHTQTTWHEVQLWGPKAEYAARNFSPGTIVAIKAGISKTEVEGSHPKVYFKTYHMTPVAFWGTQRKMPQQETKQKKTGGKKKAA